LIDWGKLMEKLGVNVTKSTLDVKLFGMTVNNPITLPVYMHNQFARLLTWCVNNKFLLASQKTMLCPQSTSTMITTTTYLIKDNKDIGGVKK
jgi:hypothetical protein